MPIPLLLSLSATLTLSASTPTQDTSTFEQRLERLGDRLEAARVAAHIPGMSIAIVKDDRVVWARGFGLADIAAQRPADENTVYAVGSTTKAFTATLVGMLVDDGKASWDDPVAKHLPYFNLKVRSEDEGAECTLRDLLCHRHGFASMPILWNADSLSREEVLRAAAAAEPLNDFRSSFHYSDVAFLAAGEAAGAAAGSTWEDMMLERIFGPLEMTSSTLTVSDAQRDPQLARGYKWVEFDRHLEHVKMIDRESGAPAGGVHSTVLDMAQWLRVLLGQGQVDDNRLVSTESILEAWAPQIEVGGGTSYGLGWMLGEHEGRKVVEHGGNRVGFSAQVGLMPEENLGYVLLMNLSTSPLQRPSLELVFDALLDESVASMPAESAETEAREVKLEDHVGTYVANFAAFRDVEFAIRINGDRLALDIPNQGTFDLSAPDDVGKWFAVQTDQIALSFQRDDRDAVIGLTVHQGGFHFEVPRKGFVVKAEVRASELANYVGTFVRAQGGKRVEISIKRGRLVMEDKGNHLAFNTPDAEGHASLRAREDHGATFKTDPAGSVESFVYHGEAGDVLFTRLFDSSKHSLPTLEEVLALRKADARIAFMASGGTKVSGEVWFPQAGVRGTLTTYTQGNDRYAHHMDFGKFGRMDMVVKGSVAWSYGSFYGFNVLDGDELAQAILGHPGAVDGDWDDYFDSAEVIGTDTAGDRPVHVVRLKRGTLPSCIYWVDAGNGDVLRANRIFVEDSFRIPTTIAYSDFKDVGGIRIAMRVEVQNPSGKTVLTIKSIASGLQFGDDTFTLEDPDAK